MFRNKSAINNRITRKRNRNTLAYPRRQNLLLYRHPNGRKISRQFCFDRELWPSVIVILKLILDIKRFHQ